MKLLIFSLLFYSPLLFAEKLILSIGEKKLLPLPSNNTIRIGDKSLVHIQKEGALLSLRAKKTGQSRVIVGDKKHEIFIFSEEQKEQALKLKELLKAFQGLKWSFSNNSFQITGKLHRLYDWVKIAETAKTYNINYEFKALPEEDLKQTISYYFQKKFSIKMEILWESLPLVNVPKGSHLKTYHQILQAFGLKAQEDSNWLFKAPFIEIEIAVVESLKSSGFSFGKETEGDSSLSYFSSLLNLLNFLRNSGKGKSLYHSVFTSQSGEKLQIQSGGQIPFNSYNLKTEQVNSQWRSYGLKLNITPTIGKKDHIQLNIQAQFSEPLSFGSINSPPPLKTQSFENQMIVTNNQIIKLLQINKKSQGSLSKAQMAFSPDKLLSFLRGSNRQEVIQSILIQARIKDSNEKSKNLKNFFKEKHSLTSERESK